MSIQDSKKFYKEIGAKGLKEVALDYHVAEDIKFVKKNAKRGEKILDLACGYGRVTIPLAKAGYKNIIGIDLSPNLINDARKEARLLKLKINFDIGDMISLPYSDNQFDKIFCLWNSFNEILEKKNQIKVLKEVHRVLRSKGRAFFILVSPDSSEIKQLEREKKLGTNKAVLKRYLKGSVIYHYMHTKETLVELLKYVNFKKSTIKSVRMHHRRRILLVLEKA